MTTITLQQAAEACQTNKAAWLNRKSELAAAEQEYREQLLAVDDHVPARMQELRDITDIKKWEVNQAAGRYIRSHEEVQRISIRTGLNDFMQQNGAALAAILAPELMHLSGQPEMVRKRALDRSSEYLREALSVWLAEGHDISYSERDSEILTAAGYRPEAPSRDDSREQFTPAQNMIYTRRRADMAAQ
ncbi:phage polarity suppression protein [Mangrovibacter phragmitis]|uniref:phage polarity suppression protein n=1 Tax=Mangrovibacter phragmitis TaxID=1691903 RepID=UPI0035195B1B